MSDSVARLRLLNDLYPSGEPVRAIGLKSYARGLDSRVLTILWGVVFLRMLGRPVCPTSNKAEVPKCPILKPLPSNITHNPSGKTECRADQTHRYRPGPVLAYSPGVAEPVREIARDAELAYQYTGKGNLVAVISDGTAILGLGNLGPLASSR